MSRKSAPPRRVSSDTGRTCAERGRSERASERASVRARTEPRAQGRRAARRGGGVRHGNQARHGGPLPNGGRGGRSPPAPEGRGRSARAAPWRGRGPSRGGRAPMAGAGSARRGARARRVESRDTRTHATERGRQSRRLAGDPNGNSGAPFPNGARARRGTDPRAPHATTPQRRGGGGGGGGHGAESRGGPGRRHATAGRGPPRDGVGQGGHDGQADKAEETRRPPPGSEARGGKARRRRPEGRAGHRGHREVQVEDISLGARKNGREGQDRESESVRRIGTTRGLTAREAPPQAHGRSRGNPRNADWLSPARKQPSTNLAEVPGPAAHRPRPPPLTPGRQEGT